jgi:topoisomerase IV subunit B
MEVNYNEDSIKTLEWREHIRKRPGMYIGKLGNGSSYDDGIYILIKEVIDNSIDEFAMGNGKKIEVSQDGKNIRIRDYGRGIPLGKLEDVSSKMNTGAKYDSKVFKKSVGLNGVGIKAVNALSSSFKISAFRDGEMKTIHFEQGYLKTQTDIVQGKERNGTEVIFTPDEEVFGEYDFNEEHINEMLRNYVFLNSGLTIEYNGEKFISRNGLLDLLNDKIRSEALYPIIHLKNGDIEIALTHTQGYGEEYYSFVNGQYTPQGGTHLAAYKESIVRTIKEFFQKNFEASDVRSSISTAISLKVEEPVFESQTKTKLGSKDMGPEGPTIRTFINDFVKNHLDDFLHKNPETADMMLKKIQSNEKERKAISGIQKIARERAKKVSLHNKKLRDCRAHLNTNHELRLDSSIFITEGDSASGSITKARDVNTQAVFSLRGKPLNTFGLTKKVVYENEEFNLLQAALNIEEGIEQLRYRNVIIATDADVDGMHIRLLLITFFLQFFPDLIKNGHLFILQTPLFRVRNKKETIYCYTEEERDKAVRKLSGKAEVTRFKGLGEISPGEFKYFISDGLKTEQVKLTKQDELKNLLNFYMGKNTPERQDFIIENLRSYEEIID